MHQSKRTRVGVHAALEIALVGGGLLIFAAPARATNLTITPTFDRTITGDPNAAAIEATINTDISNLESYIANPITVAVTFGENASIGLADSNGTFYHIGYSSYLNALEHNQTLSAADKAALSSLGLTAPYTNPNPTNNPVNGNTQILIQGTVADALGFGTIANGTIQFNPTIVYDSRSSPVVGKYDLQSAIAHELDEVLGIGGAGSNLNNVAADFDGNTLASPPGPLDLFRYSSAGVRSYTTSNAVSPYFSIDGGDTDLVHFNQFGGGSDFADWGDGVAPADGQPNSPPQVQDAFAGPYEGPSTLTNLGANELTALDVIGWNLTSAGQAFEPAPVPEPASIGLLAVGAIGLFGFFGRRGRAES